MFTHGKTLNTGLVFFTLFFLFTTIFGQNIRIMPLGDSITRGLSSTDNTGYRRYLYILLTGHGYNVDFVGSQNLGIPTDFNKSLEAYSGWYADGDPDTTQNRNIATHIYSWLKNNPADIVILHIGTNDIDNGDSSAIVVNHVENILNEIDRYETNFSRSVRILLCQIINRADKLDGSQQSKVTTDFNKELKTMVNQRLQNTTDKINLVNLETGAGLNYNIDFQSPFLNGDMANNLHPNNSGYKKIAQKLFYILDSNLTPDTSAQLRLFKPVDYSINQFQNLTFVWHSSPNADTYRLQIASDTLFSTIFLDRQDIADTSFSVTGFSDTTEYYWRVMGINQNGNNISYSRMLRFKTAINNLSVPKLAYPNNNSTNLQTKLTLKWNSTIGAKSYTFNLAKDSGFVTMILSDSGIVDTLEQLSNLQPGTKYFWKIIAKGYSGSEVSSEIRSFITLMNPPQNLQATEDSSGRVLLTWKYPDKNSPRFIIERKNTKTQYNVIDTLKSDSTQYIDRSVNIKLTYSYRIKAYNNFAVSNYSNEVTLLVTSVIDAVRVDKYYLFQNYPNPFNPSTVISYQIPAFSHVELKVYDILGREIATLVNTDQNAGRYEIAFSTDDGFINGSSGNGLSSGIYFYQLKTKNYTAIKKMLLLR